MEKRIIDKDIMLVPYYPNYAVSLNWYQEANLCKQPDNRDDGHGLELLKKSISI